MYDDKKNVIFAVKRKNEGSYSNSLPYKGRYSVCFESQQFSFVSFDFELSHTKANYAEAHQVSSLAEKAKNAIDDFQQIYRSQFYQSERETVHLQYMKNTERNIKFVGLIKVALIVCLGMAQFLFIKRSFGQYQHDSVV